MTPEEFDAISYDQCDDRYRYELIRGVFVVSPMAGRSEMSPNDFLGYHLWNYHVSHPQGSILDDTCVEFELPLGENRRRCDRAIWLAQDKPPEETDFPTIVVEFVSSRKRDFIRDYETKRDEYLAAGIREYWIIDRFRRTMTVFKPGAEGPVSVVVQENETYQTELLPGFALPLASLFARSDRLCKATRTRRKPPAQGAE
jgi:Uma2 family endonuclease